MPFRFLAREAGRVHVCGHRGYSVRYPANTMPAFSAAKAWGATTVEIDVVLTADGEPIVLHDRTLDRTTDGHGFAAYLDLEQIRSLDAGAGFNSRFARTPVPTVAEVLEWAKREEMGLLLEIKEAERSDLAVDRVADLLEAMDAADRVIVISFDHVVLRRAIERHPGMGTEAITHARHVDIVGMLHACGARSVSIELDMFHPDDAKALHDAGFSNRVSLPRPEVLAEDWRGGRDIIPAVVQWIAEGAYRHDLRRRRSVPWRPGRLREVLCRVLRATHAAGKLSFGTWDHWVPSASPNTAIVGVCHRTLLRETSRLVCYLTYRLSFLSSHLLLEHCSRRFFCTSLKKS
jgi:glycerophosphoryl diester phosphodiesterase